MFHNTFGIVLVGVISISYGTNGFYLSPGSNRHPLGMMDQRTFGAADWPLSLEYPEGPRIQALTNGVAKRGNYVAFPRRETRKLTAGPIARQIRQEQNIQDLYSKIAEKFPFLVQQGLLTDGERPSLDKLLSMTVFGQPVRRSTK